MDDSIKLVQDNKPKETIGNKLGPQGQVLCPVCGHGSTWYESKRNGNYTCPMRKVVAPGVNAHVHGCCLGGLAKMLKK